MEEEALWEKRMRGRKIPAEERIEERGRPTEEEDGKKRKPF